MTNQQQPEPISVELSELELETVASGKVIGPGFGPGFGPRWGWGGGWGGWGWGRGGAVGIRGPFGGGLFVRW